MNRKGIFVGLSTIDIIYTVSKQPRANQKVTAESQQIVVGGPATNAAITFAYLGGSATLVTSVGLHPLSSCTREDCTRFGIELIDLAPESHEPPAVSSVTVDAEGQRSVVSVNAVGRDISSPEVQAISLGRAQTLLVDGHAMQACQAWAQAARGSGIPVIFDGGSWKPGTERLLESVDVAICSADFLPPGCSNSEEVTEYLRASGVTRIAISHGADPIHAVSELGMNDIQVPHVEVLDTTGAGDVLHGAFCFHYSGGCGFEEALRRAALVASESCRYRGTREWMRRPQQ